MSSLTVPLFAFGMRPLGPRNLPILGVMVGKREGVEMTLVGVISPDKTWGVVNVQQRCRDQPEFNPIR